MLTALLLGCLVVHGELYRLRPPAGSLTVFYLAVSAGGALGGLFVALVVPHVFDDYYELPIAAALSALVVGLVAWRDRGWVRQPVLLGGSAAARFHRHAELTERPLLRW